MSYEKAMRWHKKHPKGIKNLFMGFDSCSKKTPSMSSNPRFVACEWFKQRHSHSEGAQYVRDCVREQIKIAREQEQRSVQK